MSVKIVDLFEVIDVHKQHAEWRTGRDEGLDGLMKGPMAKHPGQLIPAGPFLALGIAKCFIKRERTQAYQMHQRLVLGTGRSRRVEHLDRPESLPGYLELEPVPVRMFGSRRVGGADVNQHAVVSVAAFIFGEDD